MERNVLVFGWYGHRNIGDEAFKDSFRYLFPDLNLKFTDQIPSNVNEEYAALIVGGGSFLDQQIKNLDLVTIPIAFVGIGLDGIHPANQPALDRAKIVVTRSKLKGRAPKRYFQTPDLVFAQAVPPVKPNPDIITVMVNNHFCPGPHAEPYKSAAWEWFSVEFSQTCDRLVAQYRCPIWFVPMCTHPTVDDRRAAAYIIDRMEYKGVAMHIQEEMSRDQIMEAISRSHMLISQRFHGLVFAAMMGKPFVAIDGHSKIKNLCNLLKYEGTVDYYGYSMSAFWKAVSRSNDTKAFAPYVEKAKQEWAVMSGAIKTALFG